jgi:hypothetical protein
MNATPRRNEQDRSGDPARTEAAQGVGGEWSSGSTECRKAPPDRCQHPPDRPAFDGHAPAGDHEPGRGAGQPRARPCHQGAQAAGKASTACCARASCRECAATSGASSACRRPEKAKARPLRHQPRHQHRRRSRPGGVLLELDMRRPGNSRILGISPQDFTSVSNYLQDGSNDSRNCSSAPASSDWAAYFAQAPLERASDLLASARGRQLFSGTPKPIAAADDHRRGSAAAALHRRCAGGGADARCAAVRGRRGPDKAQRTGRGATPAAEFNVIGTVLNKSVETDPKSTTDFGDRNS